MTNDKIKHTQYCSIAYSLYCNCHQSKPDKYESYEPIITMGELYEGCE